MEYRGVRYAIVTGNTTLLAAFACAALSWFCGSGKASDQYLWWGGFGATVLAAYLLLEFNNRFSLLRIRSHMMPSVFLAMAAAMPFGQTLSWDFLPPICLLLAYYSLFLSYQNFRSQGYAFHAFAFLGIGALVFPQMLYFAPLFMLFMLVQLRSMSGKAFVAALLGMAAPIALREVFLLLNGSAAQIDGFWVALRNFPHPDYATLDEHRLVSAALVILVSLAATVHFLRTRFNDKIRTRMFFYVIMLEEAALIALAALQPQHFDVLFKLLLVNGSILAAHHLSLARGIAADVYFYTLLALFCFLAFYNFTGYDFGIWPL